MFLSVSLFAASLRSGSRIYVSVKQAALKSDNSTKAKNVRDLFYGDCLIVESVSGKYIKVVLADDSSVSGWVQNSQITSKKITRSALSASSATSDELALAGKGFSEAAEKAFRTENTFLDYKKVDAIEKINISEKELSEFIKEGKLNGGDQ